MCIYLESIIFASHHFHIIFIFILIIIITIFNFFRPSIASAESKHSSGQNIMNNQNNYNNVTNVQGFVRTPTQSNSIDSIRNDSKPVHINSQFPYNTIKPKSIIPVKPVVPIPDNTKLENSVTEKLQKSLAARYLRLSDDLDEEFGNQNCLGNCKENLKEKLDNLILLKARFEIGIEEMEKKNEELGKKETFFSS